MASRYTGTPASWVMGMALQVPLSIRWLVRPPPSHNSVHHYLTCRRTFDAHPVGCYCGLTKDVCVSPFVLVRYSDRVKLGKDILVGMLTVITRTAKGRTSRVLLDGGFSRSDGPSLR